MPSFILLAGSRLHDSSAIGAARIKTDVLRKWIIRLAPIGHDRLPRAREVLRILDEDAILECIRVFESDALGGFEVIAVRHEIVEQRVVAEAVRVDNECIAVPVPFGDRYGPADKRVVLGTAGPPAMLTCG